MKGVLALGVAASAVATAAHANGPAEPKHTPTVEVSPPFGQPTKGILISGFISNDDYPVDLRGSGEAGTATANFTIGADGGVKVCNASGASPRLDALTCQLILERFRFRPARDAYGVALEDRRTQRVTWRPEVNDLSTFRVKTSVPAPPPPSLSKSAVQISGSITADDYPSGVQLDEGEVTSTARYTIEVNGRVSECTASGASPEMNARTCGIIRQRWLFTPARDIEGKVTVSALTQDIKWSLPKDPNDLWSATARLTAKSYGVKIALSVDTMGKVDGCKVEALTPDAERDRFICALAKDQWTFPVDRNDAGKPIKSVRMFGSVPRKTGEPLSF